MKTNDAVDWAVSGAVYGAVYWAVSGAVYEAVYEAVFGAVNLAVRGDPTHPSLTNFLAVVDAEVP